MARTALREHVDAVMGAPDAFATLRRRIGELGGDWGPAPALDDVDNIIDLARDYVEAVIVMIDDSDDAGAQRGLQKITTPLIRQARGYFIDPDDVIPDSEGLYGLLDDAYLAHCFVIRISELVKEERGFPLLSDLNPELLPVIRAILGADLTAQLDGRIADEIEKVRVRTHFAQLTMLTGTLPNGALDEWRKVLEDKKRMRWAPEG